MVRLTQYMGIVHLGGAFELVQLGYKYMYM